MESISKYKRYKPSGIDWIGDLPEHWEIKKLKNILLGVNSGDGISVNEMEEDGEFWNTGSTNASVSITQPGWYWLQVKDNNNCTGRDSIYVTVKECLKGVFVPTGFTPNHDGRNDELRPLVFGNILKYEFIVYDRAGQLMFRSVIPGEGWNGMYKGLPPNSGVFVWVCRYQLSGETEKLQKGTVVLIR